MHYKELLDAIRTIILKHASPVRIYLYGSRATGDAGETSDIDIAYDDKECKGHCLIEEEIQKLPTLVKIDVKNIAFTEERFRNRVVATGKVLFSATKKLRFEKTRFTISKRHTRDLQAPLIGKTSFTRKGLVTSIWTSR